MYNWDGIKYPTLINNTSYTYLKEKIWKLLLQTMFKLVVILSKILNHLLKKLKLRFVYINQSDNHACQTLSCKRKKSSFIINSIQHINQKTIADVSVSFYDKSKFENNAIHESKNGVDWTLSDNENKHKNL